MRKFTVTIRTNKIGSDCVDEFEVEDDATYDEIEEIARDVAFEKIDWYFVEDIKDL